MAVRIIQPQIPPRPMYYPQPQQPAVSVDIGRKDDDSALLLALLQMINQQEESQARRELERELTGRSLAVEEMLARMQQEQLGREEERGLRERLSGIFTRTDQSLTDRFSKSQDKLLRDIDQKLREASKDPAVEGILKDFRKARREGVSKSESNRLVGTLPDRVFKVLQDTPDPVVKAGKARAIMQGIEDYFQTSTDEYTINHLATIIEEALPGVVALAGELESRPERPSVVERILKDRATQFQSHLNSLWEERQATVDSGVRGADLFKVLDDIGRRPFNPEDLPPAVANPFPQGRPEAGTTYQRRPTTLRALEADTPVFSPGRDIPPEEKLLDLWFPTRALKNLFFLPKDLDTGKFSAEIEPAIRLAPKQQPIDVILNEEEEELLPDLIN